VTPRAILFVNYGDEPFGGQERVVLDLIDGLDRTRFRPVMWCNAPSLATACTDRGVPVVCSHLAHFLDYSSPAFNPRRWLALVREGRRLIARHKAAVVHANGAAPLQWMVPAARLAGIPVLGHIHTRYLRRSRYVLLCHAADLIVGVSRRTIAPFLDDGMAEARVRVVHNGIDTRRLGGQGEDLRARFGIGREVLLLLSVGALIPLKAHDVLLHALASLPPSDPAPRLLIVGDGPSRGDLERLAAALGLADRVQFLGRLADPSSAYRAADLFVLPSRQEGFPLVVLEAGWFGLARIATDVGGVPEAVRHGETGLIVPPDDVRALAEAIARLGADAQMRRRFGEAARAEVIARFTLTRMVDTFQDLYAELAKASGRGSVLRPYLRLFGSWPRERALGGGAP